MLLFTEVKEAFKEEQPEYNPGIMWFWNDDISENEISYQLERFREQDIVEFFIHPMYGFRIDYLSERYFQLIRYAVNEAGRLGMKFWIYDEYNWPSGTAGLKVCEDHPELTQRLLQLVETHQIGSG